MSLLYYLAPVSGIVALIVGIAAVVAPQPMAKKFGIAVRGEAIPYVISTGIRDVFIGLMILLLFSRQDWPLLGAANLFVSFVALSDFFAVRKYGDRKTSFVHLIAAMAALLYGAWLVAGH